MKVLALTHGPSVGPGVFGEAVRDAGHDLVERRVPLAGARPRRRTRCSSSAVRCTRTRTNGTAGCVRSCACSRSCSPTAMPLFGVCLGAQLIARAAGAEVLPAPEPEVGWLPVELTGRRSRGPGRGSLPQRFDAFQWHHYTHELPAGAEELARSAVCTQAFRLGSAWGVQFHPEVHATQVESWLDEEPAGAPDPERLRAETRERIEAWNELGRELCGAFLATV